MNLFEFNLKTLNQQIQLLEDKGIYLTTRVEGNCHILLIYLNNFFVEIWYGPKYDQIIQVKSFISLSYLDPYLELVCLGELN